MGVGVEDVFRALESYAERPTLERCEIGDQQVNGNAVGYSGFGTVAVQTKMLGFQNNKPNHGAV